MAGWGDWEWRVKGKRISAAVWEIVLYNTYTHIREDTSMYAESTGTTPWLDGFNLKLFRLDKNSRLLLCAPYMHVYLISIQPHAFSKNYSNTCSTAVCILYGSCIIIVTTTGREKQETFFSLIVEAKPK